MQSMTTLGDFRHREDWAYIWLYFLQKFTRSAKLNVYTEIEICILTYIDEFVSFHGMDCVVLVQLSKQ